MLFQRHPYGRILTNLFIYLHSQKIVKLIASVLEPRTGQLNTKRTDTFLDKDILIAFIAHTKKPPALNIALSPFTLHTRVPLKAAE